MNAAITAPERVRRGTDRTREVAQAALACFTSGGYRLTQIAYVAARLGVSVGSVYRYVDSKEALFHLALMETLGRVDEASATPLTVTGLRNSVAILESEVARDRLWPVLKMAARAPSTSNPRGEAEAIGAELYDAIFARAAVICLLDRCAHETPELAELFDQRIRHPLMVDLVAWATRRTQARGRPQADTEALARGAMEAVAWLAKSRLGDPTAAHITNEQARAAAIRIFANAFA